MPGTAIQFRPFDAHMFHFAIQVTFVHVQFSGRGSAIVPVAFERGQDDLGLSGLQGRIHAPLVGGLAAGMNGPDTHIQPFRQAVGADFTLGTKHKGMFNNVFQFTHIARVIMKQKQAEGFLVDAAYGFTAPAVHAGR